MFAEVVDAAAQAEVIVSFLPRYSGAGRRRRFCGKCRWIAFGRRRLV